MIRKKGKRAMYVLKTCLDKVIKQVGISKNKLSQRSEVSYNIIKAIVDNPYREVEFNTLNRLAAILEVKPTELLESVTEEEALAEQETLKKKKRTRS